MTMQPSFKTGLAFAETFWSPSIFLYVKNGPTDQGPAVFRNHISCECVWGEGRGVNSPGQIGMGIGLPLGLGPKNGVVFSVWPWNPPHAECFPAWAQVHDYQFIFGKTAESSDPRL